jgi:hypothetical protein
MGKFSCGYVSLYVKYVALPRLAFWRSALLYLPYENTPRVLRDLREAAIHPPSNRQNTPLLFPFRRVQTKSIPKKDQSQTEREITT